MSDDGSVTKRGLLRLRTRMTQGLVALVPIVVTVFAVRFLFDLTSGILLPFIDPALEEWPTLWRAALSVATLLLLIYLLGEVSAAVVGRRLLTLGEKVVLRVPLVRVVYRASKQVAEAFQGPGTRAFKAVVFLEFPHPGMRALGFLTGRITKEDGTVWCTVFMPTTPNPTTGFLQIVPEADVVTTDFTVEEGVKMVMSLGVLVPSRVTGIP